MHISNELGIEMEGKNKLSFKSSLIWRAKEIKYVSNSKKELKEVFQLGFEWKKSNNV